MPEASQVFFSVAGTPQNDQKFHLNTLFRSNAQKSSKILRKHQQRKGFGAKILKGPPPAKADIATAIKTNVTWAFSVAELHPNKHAFAAKAVWVDLMVKLVGHKKHVF